MSDISEEEEEEEEVILPDIIRNYRNGSGDGSQISITMTPTAEKGDTDCDSDDSEEPTNDPSHLPRRLLGGQGDVNLVSFTNGNTAGAAIRRTRRQLNMVSDEDNSEDEPEEEEEEAMFDWTKEDPGNVIPLLVGVDGYKKLTLTLI